MSKKYNNVIYVLGIIPIIWIALIIAPYIESGIIEIIKQFPKLIEKPLNITFCNNSIKVMFFFILIYIFLIAIYVSIKRNYREKEEYGSARWGNVKSINKKYKNKNEFENKILTKNMAIGLDGKMHKRNLNVLVVGGSGAGKTRFYAKPNILQANTSFVLLDPKRRTFKRYR